MNASNDDATEASVTIGFDEIGVGGVEADPDERNEERDALGTAVEDPNTSDSNTSPTAPSMALDTNEVEVTIGKKGKGVKVRRAKVNDLVLVDVFTIAMKNLIALDLPISRHRKKLRAEREQSLKKRLLKEIEPTVKWPKCTSRESLRRIEVTKTK